MGRLIATARALIAVLLVAGGLSACNTVAGAGQDLKNGAHDVQQHL
jgi:predicted small secreted protein